MGWKTLFSGGRLPTGKAEAALATAWDLLGEDATAAIAAFEHVAQLAARAGFRHVHADAELGWGEALFMIDGREREAVPHFERAIHLGAGTRVEALAWLSLADARRFFREVDQTLVAYARSIACFDALHDRNGAHLAHKGRAIVLDAIGQSPDALPHFVVALGHALASDDFPEAAELLLTIGEGSLKLNRHPQAGVALVSAAEMFAALGDDRLEARARTLLFMLGEDRQLQRMTELLARHAHQTDDARLEGISRYIQAQVLAQL